MGKLPSDYFLRFVHRRRFFRWMYASLTFFAIFAVAMGFFDLGKGTVQSGSAASTINSTDAVSEDELFLRWTYVFYPSPMCFAWLVVYFGRLFACFQVRRLWKARNYTYNLLLASLVVAAFYVVVIKEAIGLSFNSGPKRNSGIIIGACVFGLIVLNVFAERKARRKERGRQQRRLPDPQQSVERASSSPEDRLQQLSSSADTSRPNGFV